MAATDPPEQPRGGGSRTPAGSGQPQRKPSIPPAQGRRRGWLWGGLGALGLVAVVLGVSVVANRGTQETAASTQPTTQAAEALSQPSPSPSTIPPIRLSGRGQRASETFTMTEGLGIFRSKCSGCSANFIVELLDSSGQTKDVLVNAIGSYDGSKAVGLDAGRYRLNVTADAAWSITITQPRNERAAKLPQTYKGKGDQVVGPFDADHAVEMQGAYKGQSNFIVVVLDAAGAVQDAAFNEIGSFDGSTVAQMLGGGPYFVNVTADGSWTLRLSKP
ncbi:hypothetical protein ACF09L_16630 [Streptomyces sp. NPDC014779]|uniref:hypothetical protein n=1 Tax=unclassified Streptomyces TaxID=2593676 RepID=UPI0036FA439D